MKQRVCMDLACYGKALVIDGGRLLCGCCYKREIIDGEAEEIIWRC